MSAVASLVASLLTLAAAACLYLGAPHQRWLASRLRPVPACAAGALSLAAALALWMQALRPITAVFVAVTVLMAALTALPFLGALRARRRERGNG